MRWMDWVKIHCILWMKYCCSVWLLIDVLSSLEKKEWDHTHSRRGWGKVGNGERLAYYNTISMTNKERINQKIEHTEKILKWIKVLNDTDNNKQLQNAIWFLKCFIRDIESICYWKNTDYIVTGKFKVDINGLPLLNDIDIPIQVDNLTNEIRYEDWSKESLLPK